MAAILALGNREKKNNEDWKHIPLQLSFISFSCSKVRHYIRSQEVVASRCVCYVAFETEGSILQAQEKKTHSLSMSFKSTKAKNDFGRDHRTPLACSSCFTVQLPCIARRVAVAMNHRFSETVPSAQGLCQTLSVSQASLPFDSSAAAAAERREKRGPSALRDNIIAPTGRVCVRESKSRCAGALHGCEGEKCTHWWPWGESAVMHLNAPSAAQEKMNPGRESARAFLKVTGAWLLFERPRQL